MDKIELQERTGRRGRSPLDPCLSCVAGYQAVSNANKQEVGNAI